MLLQDFLDMVKVLRMLYGVAIAKEYFELHVNEFSEFDVKDLFAYQSYANLEITPEK